MFGRTNIRPVKNGLKRAIADRTRASGAAIPKSRNCNEAVNLQNHSNCAQDTPLQVFILGCGVSKNMYSAQDLHNFLTVMQICSMMHDYATWWGVEVWHPQLRFQQVEGFIVSPLDPLSSSALCQTMTPAFHFPWKHVTKNSVVWLN